MDYITYQCLSPTITVDLEEGLRAETSSTYKRNAYGVRVCTFFLLSRSINPDIHVFDSGRKLEHMAETLANTGRIFKLSIHTESNH